MLADQELILLAYDSAEKPFDVYLFRRASRSVGDLHVNKTIHKTIRLQLSTGLSFLDRVAVQYEA